MATRVVVLAWTDNATSPQEDGFAIQRKDGPLTGPGVYADLATVGQNVQTFTDPASPMPSASYRVRATSASLGDSGYSNELGSILPQPGGAGRRLRR